MTATTNGGASSAPATAAKAGQKTLKILMLHGYTQSGPLFHNKTRALQKTLQKSFATATATSPSTTLVFSYPTAPLHLSPHDIPGYTPNTDSASPPAEGQTTDAWGWWRKDDTSGAYTGLETGLATIATTLRTEGPFDGVIGFSQGAAAAAMVASLLEPGRLEAFRAAESENKGAMPFPSSFLDAHTDAVIHPPLKFAVSYSGFVAPHESYTAFYHPPVRTPVLHFLGSLDTVVEEARSRTLVDATAPWRADVAEGQRVVFHPGGHFLPSQKQYLNILIGFIREMVAEREGNGGEESVEDMDVPF